MSEELKMDCPLCGSEINLETPPRILVELFHAGDVGFTLATQLVKFISEVYDKKEPRLSQLGLVNMGETPEIWVWAGATPENPIARLRVKNIELAELHTENEKYVRLLNEIDAFFCFCGDVGANDIQAMRNSIRECLGDKFKG